MTRARIGRIYRDRSCRHSKMENSELCSLNSEFYLYQTMSRRFIPAIIIILISLAIIFLRKKENGKEETKTVKEKAVNRNRGFDRRTSFIKYSKHARCRMDCREITEQEVREIMAEGKINYHKSDLKSAGCPRYALEGRTTEEQRVRIIFAQCDDSTVVVTVIDLETDYECNCD